MSIQQNKTRVMALTFYCICLLLSSAQAFTIPQTIATPSSILTTTPQSYSTPSILSNEKTQYQDFLLSTTTPSSLIISSSQEKIGGMTSTERKAGEWFFLAYVVFSLVAGAKEMTTRFTKWNDARKE
mmetsp:Transcript_3961/g.5264  ORF Transcript_3961/g.5264 Transcript_3961/m.5264 type:complete len:127 (-) Transcript_3961:222-602(-)